ncbi:hypothetical protein IWW34DRAFT_772472, partial [Fusarium oxysporum f. sp. albedinis]
NMIDSVTSKRALDGPNTAQSNCLANFGPIEQVSHRAETKKVAKAKPKASSPYIR